MSNTVDRRVSGGEWKDEAADDAAWADIPPPSDPTSPVAGLETPQAPPQAAVKPAQPISVAAAAGKVVVAAAEAAANEAKASAAPGNDAKVDELKVAAAAAADLARAFKAVRVGLLNVKADTLQIQQADKSSPLFSARTFQDLAKTNPGYEPIPAGVLRGILEGCKYEKPSSIQEKALPLMLKNPPEDMIYQSQAGTGKTAAFAITMLSRCNPAQKCPQAVCISHTIHLAQQTGEVLRELAQFTDIKVAVHHKIDQGYMLQEGQKIQEQVLVITPGKMAGYCKQEKKRHGGHFRSQDIKLLVIDEADNLLDTSVEKERDRDVLSIKNHLNYRRNAANPLQIILLSATFRDHVQSFAVNFVRANLCNMIYLPVQEVTVENIKQFYVEVDGDNGKFDALEIIYGYITVGKTIIFVERRREAQDLAQQMVDAGYEVAFLMGKQSKEEQAQILEDFRTGKKRVLITTNMLSRGIDVKEVSMVVNYEVPQLLKVVQELNDENPADCETYLHRIGRTGRFGKTGSAITLIDRHHPRELERLKEIEAYWKRPIMFLDPDDDELEDKLKVEEVAAKAQ